MENKQPQRLSMRRMFDTFAQQNMIPNRCFFKDGFAVVIDLDRFLKPFITAVKCPYLLEDFRLGIVTKGSMRSIINLQEYHVEAGDIMFVTPGSIVEPLEVSDDFCLRGMGVSADMMHLAHVDPLPSLFGGRQKHGILLIEEEERQVVEHMFGLMWEIATVGEKGRAADDGQQLGLAPAALRMIATLTSFYDSLFARQGPQTMRHQPASNKIFDSFIQLVNQHCREQRRLAFYADKLCVTERHLGTMVHLASGLTAKEWIDKAVITAAKVMLRHSDRQVVEIAEALHFPTASFFCKYFKRLSGCTPQEYRGKS